MYEILGKYNGEIEVIDECWSEDEAIYLVGEYSLAFGPEWDIWWEH